VANLPYNRTALLNDQKSVLVGFPIRTIQ
jgi:hypothetical protein